MGVQLGFMGVQLGGKVIWAGARGLRLLRELPGGSGRLSPCLPDDGAPRWGCCSPVLGCSSVPADRDSSVSAGQVVGLVMWLRRRRLCSHAECRPGVAFGVLAWTGDRSPIRGCTTSAAWMATRPTGSATQIGGYFAQVRKDSVALRDDLPVGPRAQLAGFAGCRGIRLITRSGRYRVA